MKEINKKGQTKDEVFQAIFEGVEVSNVANLTFITKYNPGTKSKEFVAEFDNENNTLYCSGYYYNVWGILQEEFEMSFEEARLFIYEKYKVAFGFTAEPYLRNGCVFG